MKRSAGLLLMILIVLSCAHGAGLEAIVRDTQRTSMKSNSFTLVWWIPTDFWIESMKTNPNLTEEAKRRFAASLDGYTILVVAAAELGPFAGVTPKDPADLRKHVRFSVNEKSVAPIEAGELPADVKNLAGMMKPMLANMLGQFGNCMEFVVYPNGSEGGSRIDPRKEGRLTVAVYDERFSWRLPLGSLLPEKRDAKTGEVFPGDYIFSPYTGDPLVTR